MSPDSERDYADQGQSGWTLRAALIQGATAAFSAARSPSVGVAPVHLRLFRQMALPVASNPADWKLETPDSRICSRRVDGFVFEFDPSIKRSSFARAADRYASIGAVMG